jgi:maltooligosyltrehalose trehalohydrolase
MQPIESRRCGAVALAEGSVSWRVWAPLAQQVDLVLINDEQRRLRPMSREERGYFSFTEANIPTGQRYAYRLDSGPERPDPASRWQPDGVHHSSAVLKTEGFVWSDERWSGVARDRLVFYELHVGTFTAEGTFDAVVPRLALLRDLGVTAIELMPVGQFPGARNWGYDGVHPYAPQNSYGGPHGLQRLVDASHAYGLAVFLDVVYNHIGPEGSYIQEFAPYFTDRYRTPWGRAVNYDGRGSDAVREYVCENVRMWIEDYHIDGLRLDAVHAIYDFGARHILADIKKAAQGAAGDRRHVYVVAESDLNDVRLLLPPERGGYGLDAQWSDDFHHTVHAYLTGEKDGYYEDFGAVKLFPKVFERTFAHDGCYSRYRGRSHGAPIGNLSGDRFVVCIQNHDQIGNRALGERLGTLISAPAQRLAASLLLLAPYLPLLFMGEEYGEAHPFQFFCSFSDADLIENVRVGRRREFKAFNFSGRELPDPQSELTFEISRLTWSWEEDPRKAGLRRLYQDLLSARQVWPAMRNFSQRAARLLPGRELDSILQLTRGGEVSESGKILQAYFNLTAIPQAYPAPEDVELLWSSESEKYEGGRRAATPRNQLLPYETVVWGPSDWQRY